MSENKSCPATWSFIILLALLLPGAAWSLDLGFQGRVVFEQSDNIYGASSPDEEEGQSVGAVLGIYGEQRSRGVTAAFEGEIDTSRNISEEDSSFDTLTRFLGAAEFSITPRSWRWYVGDVLGGVRVDNALQSIDDSETERRNVFVTGPNFAYDVEGRSRTRASLLYVNQTANNETLETLYTASASYERDMTPGSYVGIRAGDVFTEQPEDPDNLDTQQGEDFNRSTVAVYVNRARGFLDLFGELGVTRYDADEESLNGLNATLRADRQLGPKTSVSISLNRDLKDQTLSTVESLIESGGDTVGVRPEVADFYTDTRLNIAYSFQASRTSFGFGAGVSQKEYESVESQDQLQGLVYGSFSQQLSSRLRSELAVSYERQTYDNNDDETESVLASALLAYRLSRSFELEGGVVHDTSSGILTSSNPGSSEGIDIDTTENRVFIALRWAPPSRASQNLTLRLKSLLQ